jgi:hypothetical protein
MTYISHLDLSDLGCSSAGARAVNLTVRKERGRYFLLNSDRVTLRVERSAQDMVDYLDAHFPGVTVSWRVAVPAPSSLPVLPTV